MRLLITTMLLFHPGVILSSSEVRSARTTEAELVLEIAKLNETLAKSSPEVANKLQAIQLQMQDHLLSQKDKIITLNETIVRFQDELNAKDRATSFWALLIGAIGVVLGMVAKPIFEEIGKWVLELIKKTTKPPLAPSPE